MRSREFVRKTDVLAHEEPLFDIPLRKEYLLRELGRGKRVLDLGCLGGQLSQLIKNQNNEVFGVEANPRAAEAAESRGIRVKQFDLNDGIPFEDSFFDAIHAGQILENIYDTKYLLEECSRVLKPSGALFFTILNLNSLENRLRVLLGGYPSVLGAYPEDHRGENIRAFNAAKLRELCEHTGFRLVELFGVPGDGPLYQVLRPVVRLVPQLGEVLVVKAKRSEH